MDQGTVARIEDWEVRAFPGGPAGLASLAEESFTGAVTARGAWLFMLNGRVVGTFDGTMDDFEGADATAYEAPDPALPLLFAMRERGGETRAKYYTDDTPLSEVDGTLSEAGFTGYIELSENVLSGDYYVVYYGGRSMSAAFIGNEERLITGDEAFERADDEVGIYEVRDVELDVQDVPEPEGATGAGGDPPPETTAEPEPESDPATEPDAGADPDPEPEPSPEPESDPEPEPEPDVDSADTTTSPEPEASGDATADTGAPADETRTADRADTEERAERPREEARSGDTTGEPGAERPEAKPGEDPFDEEEAWRETRQVPALDPEETGVEGRAGGGVESGGPDRPDATSPEPEPDPEPATVEDRIEELQSALEAQNSKIEHLREELDETAAERDDLVAERDRLEQRISELESELESAQEAAAAASEPAGESASDGGAGARAEEISPDEALSRTDLFVRYGSKGKATLENAHGGSASKSDVKSNLRIEDHTRFDASEVAVAGQGFEEFLESTIEYRFVRWLIGDVLYEIQDTGSESALRDLYDALPRIDRAEFNGTVEIEDEESGEIERSFDVVVRDRMGQPLVVANINDDRDPATGGMMSDLVESATDVAAGHDTLGAAFLVTASFFAPDALETATEATSGGLLSRESRKSFVKLSRKQGYHLCLVEARRDEFHLAVPEL